MKTCSKCREQKSSEEFNKDKNKKDGRCYYCKECARAITKSWSSANAERKRRTDYAYKKANPEKVRDCIVRWRADNPKHLAYSLQRSSSQHRGIPFLITLEEWIEFWGNDFDKRGRSGEELQMCRYGDTGAYEIGNIYKATALENNTGPRFKEEAA